MTKCLSIPNDTVVKIISFLREQPFKDVAGLIDEIVKSCKAIEEKECCGSSSSCSEGKNIVALNSGK